MAIVEEKSGAEQRQKLLRIAVIRAGEIVEERLLRRREKSVTIGRAPRNTFVASDPSLPAKLTLFELDGDGRYRMVFSDAMRGRVSVGGEVMPLEQLEQQGRARRRGDRYHLRLDDGSRGKLVLGEITVLFQLVTPPPLRARPQLPPSVRGSLARRIDWSMTSSFAASAAVVVAFVGYAHTVDAATSFAADVIPDEFARYAPTVRQPRPALFEQMRQKAAEDTVERVRRPKHEGAARHERRDTERPRARETRPCNADCRAKRAAGRRERLAARVAKMGALRLLGSRGAGGVARDLLRDGDPGASADKAFEGVGRLSLASRGSGGLRGKSSGGSAKAVTIDGLGGRVGGPASVAIRGRVVERVVRGVVKRAGKIRRDDTLPGSDVARVIRRGMRAVQACYQRALKRDPKLGGKIEIRLTIASLGSVASTEIEHNSVAADVGSCVARVAKRWRFSPPRGGQRAEVAVPFVFKAAR